ncbi:glycosyltransferase [Mesorhizobium sp. ASY16-5R]|uniref:glycosyltransferase n=1 Tax=Mesorhizobium sp. ASY16-5R TaxID=3445772 RepID=UPI003F9F7B76
MPGRPESHCPSVYFALAPAESGGHRLKGIARTDHLRPHTLELWSSGRLVSCCDVLSDGTWDVPITSESHAAVHAWLRAGDEQVYCGIVNAVPLWVENPLLQCDVAKRDGYVTNCIEFNVTCPIDYQVYINGRPAHDTVDFLPVPFSRTHQAHVKTRESFLVFEILANDGSLSRLPLWRWRSPGFELFRKAIRSQKYCDISLNSGDTIRDVAPIQMAVEDGGWRCHARSGRDGGSIEIDDGDILDIQIGPDTYIPTAADKKRKASVRSSRIFFKDASSAFYQPIAVTSLDTKKIKRPQTKRRILLLRPRPLPTDEIYVLAPLAQLCLAEQCELAVVNTTLQPPDADLFRDADMVVVVRYISANWMDELVKCKGRVEIIYLFDDDIPSAVDTPDLPATYRRRLTDVTFCDFQYMFYISDLVIVSSPYLLKRFNTPKTYLLEPPSIRESESLDHHLDGSPLRIGYHGSSTHCRDLEFIIPAIKRLSKENPGIHFDLFGHKAIREMIHGFDRINLMDPLPWEDYKEFSRRRPCHITVAPLLDNAYNRGKSRIKFCDAGSLGAAGIFTNNPIYRGIVDHGINGLLVSNTEDEWLGALRSLAADPDRTYRIASACRLANQDKCSLSEATRFWAELLNVGAFPASVVKN